MSARKNISPTSSALHPDIYTQIASDNAGECWLCGLNGKHATQVVSTPDLPLDLHELQRCGVVQLAELNALENLVFLCTACHDVFDDPGDAWVFLPAYLDTFIAAEESFQADRQRAAAGGHNLDRPAESAAMSPVLYSRYQIRPRYLFTHVFTDAPTRAWHGSPLAAVIRSARIVAKFQRLPAEQGGIPIDVALKLQKLLLLFGAPEPQLLVPPQEAPIVDGGDGPHSQIVLRVRPGATGPGGANQNQPMPAPFSPGANSPGVSADASHDLSFVGWAFNSALKYVHDSSSERNMTSEARAWLTAEIHCVVRELQNELRKLHKHKDNPALLPEYATNHDVPLELLSTTIPSLMVPYHAQFIDCLTGLFNACGFNATCVPRTMGRGRLFLQTEIRFEPGGAQGENQTVGNRLFDPGFEEEFVRAVQALSMQPN